MKHQNLFSEPSKSEFRGRRNTNTKDKHREPSDLFIDGNIKKYHRHDDDFSVDIEDLVELDPSFDWNKIR